MTRFIQISFRASCRPFSTYMGASSPTTIALPIALLSGLHFISITNVASVFFPNNDANAVRRLRIKKALEYGAVRVGEWTEGITHVIVDKGVQFKHITQSLKLEEIPVSIRVVNEDFPLECIRFHCVLNPKDDSFRVPGYNADAAAATSKRQADSDAANPTDGDAQPSAHSSLPLKPAGRGVLTREPQTPPISDESSIERRALRDLNEEEAPVRLQKRAARDPSPQSKQQPSPLYNDTLEEAINKTKAFKDIVSVFSPLEVLKLMSYL